MGQTDLIIGPVLLGSWVASCFMGIEMLLYYQYVKYCSQDNFWLKLFVFVTFLASVINTTLGAMPFVYFTGVTSWGDLAGLYAIRWCQYIECLGPAVVGFNVQLFMIHRIHKFSKMMIVTVGLVFLAVAGLAGACWNVVNVHLYVGGNQTLHSSIFYFTVNAALDVFLAALLTWHLRRIDTTVESTRAMIRQLIIKGIETGTITSVWALLVIITFKARQNTYICLFFLVTIDKFYFYSLIVSLLNRSSFRDQLSSHTFQLPSFAAAVKSRNANATRNETNFAHAVQINRTIEIEKDSMEDEKIHDRPSRRSSTFGDTFQLEQV